MKSIKCGEKKDNKKGFGVRGEGLVRYLENKTSCNFLPIAKSLVRLMRV